METAQHAVKPSSSPLLWGTDLLNRVGRLLRSMGIRIGNANAERIMRNAMKKSGVTTILNDSFQKPLEILVQSANQQADLSWLGRLAFRERLTRFVTTRLTVDATLAATPEMLHVPIVRPIFIAALPRTGTTLLHRLFAQDASLRIPQCWEMLCPCPPPDKAIYTTDPRIQEVEKELALLNTLAPQMKTIHEIGACLPEECIILFAHELMSDWFTLCFDLPLYRNWLDRQDPLPLYARHKHYLQLLQYRCPGERWVLKAPSHLRALTALAQIYPDACILQTHRDPAEVIPSLASLLMAFRNLFHERIQPETVGEFVLEYFGFWLDRGMADRARLESDPDVQVHFLDVDYTTLVTDPLGTLQGIYEHCGLSWSSSLEHQMSAFLEEHRQHKHGKHHYSLAQFGLTEEQVHARFAAYHARFLSGAGGL